MRLRSLFLCATFLAVDGTQFIQKSLPGPSAPPLSEDDVSALVTGEFSGNTHVDAVVLANGKPVLRESVETYQTYLESDVTAVDIARLKATGTGGRDQLIAVGPSGLSLLEIQAPAVPPWASTSLRGAGTHWANAIAVHTGQVDGVHGEDIVAVTPSRVLIAKSNGAGGWMSDVISFAGANVTGFELVDWDGAAGGALEIAVLIGRNSAGAAKIRLMRADGTVVGLINTDTDALIASTVATETDGPRWLAAIGTTTSTGVQELAILSTSALAGPWLLNGEAKVYDSVAVDWDSNGLDDLVLATSAARDFSLYRTWLTSSNELTLHPMDQPPEHTITLPVGHPQRIVSAQDGRMDVADVDLDGDLDLVTAVQGTYAGTTWHFSDSRFSSVDVTLNLSVDHELWIPWHRPGTPWPAGLPLPEHTASGDLSVPLLTPVHVLEGAQYECAVWRTPTIESLAIPTPIFGPGTLAIGSEGSGTLTWSTLTFPIGQFDPLFPDRYTLIARQVRRGPGGIIEAEKPALKVTFFSALHADEFSIDWNITTEYVLEIPEPDQSGGVAGGPGVPPTPPNQQP